MRRKGWAAIAATAALATALATATMAPASAAGRKAEPVEAAKPHAFQGDPGKFAGFDPHKLAGRVPMFVQFRGTGAAALQRQGVARVQSRRAEVQRQASSVLSTARRADSKAASLFTVSNVLPGTALVLDAAGARAVAKRGDVLKVWRISPKTTDNANTASFVKALNVWAYNGGLGKGVRVAVIDTGLDYTHADFGGPGTSAAYDAQSPTTRTWWQDLSKLGKAKIAGGYDFAGDDYNADPDATDYQPIPDPDPNPLDCGGHGSHVAGTTLGYGVTKGGKTFTGNYAKLSADKLMAMKVGPGMAPAAKVYSYKVFGCEGSTNVVMEALDRAVDPNGDGRFEDHVDIINMSLGSPYGPVDDPENAVVNELTKYGVLTVASNGNEGDLTDVGGSPGNSVTSLAVGSTVDAYQLLDGLKVNAPGDVAGMVAGQFSVAYNWADEPPVTGAVVALSQASNLDGCSALNSTDAAAVAGKIAWLTWDSDDTTRRCGSAGRSANVANAGAIGAVFTGDVSPFGAGITGSATIPVFQLTKNATAELQPAVTAGTLNVTFDGQYGGTIKDMDSSIADTISSFTSRGNHGSIAAVKPDVAAPGDTIVSADVGSGNGGISFSGTSMASPLTAGVAALVKAKHPGWSPLQLKAAVVNTAGHDLYTGPNHTGDKYGPARVGTGRVDAKAAFKTEALAYVGKNNAVSATFAPLAAPIDGGPVARSQKVTVQNVGKSTTKFTVSYQAINSQDGISYSVSPASFKLAKGKKTTVTVTMTVDPAALSRTIDPTMAESQLGLPRQFVPDASGRLLVKPADKAPLRVAVYGTAKPASTTTASVNGTNLHFAGAGVFTADYESIYSVMTLGAESDELPECGDGTPYADGTCVASATERAGDIRYVGAGADDESLWFGLATHGEWANIGNVVIPYVDYDVDGDGEADYETYVQNYPDTDLPLAITVDLHTGVGVDQEPVNFLWANQDTNVFDSNVILMPVWKSEIADYGSTEVTGDITYTVGTYYAWTGADIDSVEADGAFNADTPAFSVGGRLWSDQGDTDLAFSNTGGPTKALVFHLHGVGQDRAQVLDIP